jgi:signal transduction histidine kinase
VKSWLLAAKIAIVFMVVLLVHVVVTLHLFSRTVMHHGSEAHHDFVLAVLWLMLAAMIVIIGLSVYVTAPLRRMSRSMDRIAAGDLEHRVRVRGHDEGAVIGHSFNKMAERVHGMVTGQKEMMAGISHELRSPLARMKVSLELLREKKGSAAERITDLESDVDELDGLVEEILLASRIDLGSVPLELETLDLAELCRQAWNRVATRAEAQGTTLELRFQHDAGHVQADRALAVRLFGNLFENSVRYAGRGQVTVSAERAGDRLQIAVADAGPGVGETDLARLFEPFFRADASRSRRTGAGGLGLMIVRRAIEAHGGGVEARLAEPNGLVVLFDLPAAAS